MTKDSVLNSVTLTKVTVEDEERSNVEHQTQEFSDNHQIVPGANGQRDHQQLSQDQRRERNRHDVDEVVLEQKERPEH